MAPPTLSESRPPNGRASEPTSGPEESDGDRDRRELGLDQQRKRGRVADEGSERPDIEEGHDPGVLRLTISSWFLIEAFADVRLFMKKMAPNTAIAIGSTHIRPAFCR